MENHISKTVYHFENNHIMRFRDNGIRDTFNLSVHEFSVESDKGFWEIQLTLLVEKDEILLFEGKELYPEFVVNQEALSHGH